MLLYTAVRWCIPAASRSELSVAFPEPFTALDDRAIAVLQTLLREALQNGKTVMMSTHQLREALELATHVGLVNRGKLAYTGERTAEMLSDPGWLYRNYGEG